MKVLFSRTLSGHGVRLVRDILYYFFFLQFQTRFRPGKRPVVNVDHPLDSTIPFCPSDVKKYMSFIPLWMKSLSYFRKTRGKAAETETAFFLDGLARVYREAGLIYDRCQSTTVRPAPILHPLFLQIHFFDPHLHCVPSLHVAVVIYNYLMMRNLLADGSCESDAAEIAYAQDEAAAIIDTILTVKQHSVNCVAAGLYYIHVLCPEYTREECYGLIDSLLEARAEEVPRLEEIRNYVKNLLSRFLERHDTMEKPDVRTVILEFLETYVPGNLSPEDTADERS